jgi:hypothetical protein
MTEHPTKQSWRRGDPEPPQGIDVLWDPDPIAGGEPRSRWPTCSGWGAAGGGSPPPTKHPRRAPAVGWRALSRTVELVEIRVGRVQ